MTENFSSLTPEHMLDELERALDSKKTGIRATGAIQSLNSVENRVVDFEMDDGNHYVAKFYRPQRWSREQLQAEHQFVNRIAEAEIPVIQPIQLANQTTLDQTSSGLFFAVFPKVKGRLKDELEDGEIRQLGRYLARIHLVSENIKSPARPSLTIESHIDEPLAFLSASTFLEEPWKSRYIQIAQELRAHIAPKFAQGGKPILLHGDCHVGNVLWSREGASFFLDFDDCRIGPAVQDLWMIVQGNDEESRRKRTELLSAYRVFRDLDDKAWSLAQALRACRIIYYAAWIGRRWDDPSFPNLFPQFGSPRYWQEEIDALSQCLVELSQPLGHS